MKTFHRTLFYAAILKEHLILNLVYSLQFCLNNVTASSNSHADADIIIDTKTHAIAFIIFFPSTFMLVVIHHAAFVTCQWDPHCYVTILLFFTDFHSITSFHNKSTPQINKIANTEYICHGQYTFWDDLYEINLYASSIFWIGLKEKNISDLVTWTTVCLPTFYGH